MTEPAATFAGRLLDMPQRGRHRCASIEVVTAGETFVRVEEQPGHEQSDLLIMPPIANAHDHVRGVRPISLGGFDMPLELWLAYMSNTPRVDPYLVAAAALGRQALGGVGAIMIHYTRPQDRTRVAEELEVVAKAARDIGVRVAIAVALRDRNPLGYGPDETLLRELSPVDQQVIREKLVPTPDPVEQLVALVDDVAARVESSQVTVQYGPYGLEWCSDNLLRLVAERSAVTGRRVHMHLLESRLQREYLDYCFSQGPVHYLDEIGLLSPNLSVAHGVWLRSDEIDLLAERGVTISINSSSNLTLRSGVAPVRAMHRQGVSLAMGLDGFSVDDDDDAFRELRLNYMLHRGEALDEGLSISDLLHAGCYGGRHSVTGISAGSGISAGALADFMVLDYGQISRDVVVGLDEASLLVHRATSEILKRLYVGGREIVSNGRLIGMNLAEAEAELDAQVRHGAPEFRSWQQVTQRLCPRLKNFYAAGLHCCG